MDTVGPFVTFNIIYSCLALVFPLSRCLCLLLLHIVLYSPFLHALKLSPSNLAFTILFIHLLAAIALARVSPLLPFPSSTSHMFPIKGSHLPWPSLFSLLNNRFKIIQFCFVLYLLKSANSAAWWLWMWAGTCLPHTPPLCWPLISQPSTVQPSLHYFSTLRIDYPHQMCLVTPFAPAICSPAPGMVEKSMSSYCQPSHPFFSSSTAPDHLLASLSASCCSAIDSTSIKLQHESFSFNIVWQFKSLPLEFQLYREKNTISYLSQMRLMSENFICCKFWQLKGVSSCIVLRFSCMFNQLPVYVWN